MSATLTDTPARSRKPRGQGQARRGEIIAAAKRLFVEEGFQHATMRRIAAEVGVSPTALYVYFADKEAILSAIADEMFAEMLVCIQEVQDFEQPPLERLRAGLRAYVRFGLSRPDEYRLTFQAMPEVVAQIGRPEQAERSFAVLEQSVEEMMAAGLFRPGDPVLVGEAIWCALHGVVAVLLGCDTKIASDPDQLIDAVIDMAIAGHATAALPRAGN